MNPRTTYLENTHGHRYYETPEGLWRGDGGGTDWTRDEAERFFGPLAEFKPEPHTLAELDAEVDDLRREVLALKAQLRNSGALR